MLPQELHGRPQTTDAQDRLPARNGAAIDTGEMYALFGEENQSQAIAFNE